MRLGAAFFASVSAAHESIGPIASSHGRATAAPRPRRIVRRESRVLIADQPFVGPAVPDIRGPRPAQPDLPTKSEWITLDDLGHQGREAIIVTLQPRDDLINRPPVVILQTPAQGV